MAKHYYGDETEGAYAPIIASMIGSDNPAYQRLGLIAKSLANDTTGLFPNMIADAMPDKNGTVKLSDLPDWYYSALIYISKMGLLGDDYGDAFNPNETQSRAAVVAILYTNAGEPDVSDLSCDFTDVEDGQWYTDAVKWAASNRIVVGYGDGRFGTNDPVTIEQLAIIIRKSQRLDGKIPQASDETGRILDSVKISSWAVEAVSLLNDQGIFRDIPEDDFSPISAATGAVVVSMLYRWFLAVQ
jgi:hypothetical protein